MFEVGKEVVCIKSHSKGLAKKGQRYEVLQIKKGCGCSPILLDIGATTDMLFTHCPICQASKPTTNIAWLSCVLFAPIDNTLSDLYSEELLTEIGELELINE